MTAKKLNLSSNGLVFSYYSHSLPLRSLVNYGPICNYVHMYECEHCGLFGKWDIKLMKGSHIINRYVGTLEDK